MREPQEVTMATTSDPTVSALRASAEAARKVGTVAGLTGIGGRLVLGAILGPVGLGGAAVFAAFSLGMVVQAERKETQAKIIEMRLEGELHMSGELRTKVIRRGGNEAGVEN